MIYRAELSTEALKELHGFPREAFKALAEAMGVVVENPYDPLQVLGIGVRHTGGHVHKSEGFATQRELA